MGYSKQKIYWFCQIFGWTLIIGVEWLFFYFGDSYDPDSIYLALANIMLGISLTHAYRHIIRRRNWARLPFVQLAPRVFLSVLVLASIMTFVNLPFDREMYPELFINEPSVVLGYMTSWGKTMLTWVLSYTVYHYVERNRDVEIEKILLKSSVRETEARVLRSQLNPHFVFNALNSIRALIYEDPTKAQQGITQLSNILRNSLLADRRKTVELREEIKTVEDYLALEKVRYEDRLTSRIDLDMRTLYWQVPPMMLQTLVENAIKHGVQKVVGGGFVEVTSWVETHEREGDRLHIRIRNTGVLGDKKASGGFGLENTSQRLELLYGSPASFHIIQDEPDVVCAEIVIPNQSEGLFRKETVASRH
ncbi:MAG: histidine kinase [Rudanella sp.]|nr:histidine kinase [Rudanella sp.]